MAFYCGGGVNKMVEEEEEYQEEEDEEEEEEEEDEEEEEEDDDEEEEDEDEEEEDDDEEEEDEDEEEEDDDEEEEDEDEEELLKVNFWAAEDASPVIIQCTLKLLRLVRLTHPEVRWQPLIRHKVPGAGHRSNKNIVPAKHAQHGPRRCRKQAPQNVRFKHKCCSLIIGTDATPYYVGGYCLDFVTNSCAYYSFPTAMLPQCLKVKKRFMSQEFEMNNLSFALLYWEPLILQRQKLKVYTDNNSIRKNGINPEHGEKVRVHLCHLEKCSGVKVLEKWKQHINKNNRPDDFAKYIAPADSLSRTNIQAFKAKILKSFPKIKEFDELDAIYWAANEVQERWESHTQGSCNCDMASFFKKSKTERVGRPPVKAGRKAIKVPKAKRVISRK